MHEKKKKKKRKQQFISLLESIPKKVLKKNTFAYILLKYNLLKRYA